MSRAYVPATNVLQTTWTGPTGTLEVTDCMPVAPFDPQTLNPKGSLFLTRPTLMHYVATREELLWRAHDLFAWIAAGELRVRIDQTFPLAEGAEAHRYLEERETEGKVLLIP